MDASAEDPMGFTPADVVRLGRSLGVHCPTCRVLRDVHHGLPSLAAARPTQRLVEMTFRCRRCGGPGSPHLSWRGGANEHRSFDYARALAAASGKPG